MEVVVLGGIDSGGAPDVGGRVEGFGAIAADEAPEEWEWEEEEDEEEGAVTKTPSCAHRLSPQAYTSPSSVKATIWTFPHAT